MRRVPVRAALAAVVLLLGAGRRPARAQERSELTMPPNGDNQRAEVAQWVGLVKVTIAYHSPRVHFQGRERTGHIWGELIPYGLYDEGFGPSHAAPWRAGADESTTLTVSHDVRVGGRDLKAGTYALFLELAAAGPWTWILSSNPGWGAFQYDPQEVVLRVPATPEDAPFTEFLTYDFADRLPDATTVYLRWERKRVPLRIDVPNVNALYAAQMAADLRGWPGFDYRNWQAAAQFAADNKVRLDEALVWADRAISEPFRNAAPGRMDFSTLQTKAAVLSAMGRHADADTVMDRAMRLPATDARTIHQYGLRTLAAGRTARAMTIFRTNRQLHPTERFWTYVGLARGYTATGDRNAAIASWKTALKNLPAEQQANRANLERALQALRAGS
jgi:tetratricopeptide (TPR) repeat protein